MLLFSMYICNYSFYLSRSCFPAINCSKLAAACFRDICVATLNFENCPLNSKSKRIL